MQRDEDFDASYEGLLNLTATIGEVKPRSTPDNVVAEMETGLYKDWKTADGDSRCPICLDDVRMNLFPYVLQLTYRSLSSTNHTIRL